MVLSDPPELKPAVFLGFLTLFAMIIQPAKEFSNGITALQRGTASAKRIFAVIDTVPLVENKPDAIELKSFEKDIEFKNVSFARSSWGVNHHVLTIPERTDSVLLPEVRDGEGLE